MSPATPTLDPQLLRRMDAYWRAANYLSVGQIYLYDNPLLRRPLALTDIKRILLGHWGTTPGQNFIYVHLNRVIRKYDLDMIYVSGPGHGGPALVANTYLEGTYSELYPSISQDEARQELFGRGPSKVGMEIYEVVAIVLGHVAAVYLAHVMAVRVFGDRRAALRSQYPMLALMLGYTMVSLWIIAQPIVSSRFG